MRSLAVARGTGDPRTDSSFRFIDDPGVSGGVSGARESGKHVETRDVMAIAGGDPGERHKPSFDDKLRIGPAILLDAVQLGLPRAVGIPPIGRQTARLHQSRELCRRERARGRGQGIGDLVAQFRVIREGVRCGSHCRSPRVPQIGPDRGPLT